MSDVISVFSTITFGSTIIETITGPLLNKNKNSVERFAITNTIYDLNDINQDGFYESTSMITFYLKRGNIQVSAASQVTKDSDGKYIFPTGKYIYTILSGTGKFLNARGYVIINANNTKRNVIIAYKKGEN